MIGLRFPRLEGEDRHDCDDECAVASGELAAASVRRFTVDEYHRLIETGVLREDDDVELLKDLGPIDAQELLP